MEDYDWLSKEPRREAGHKVGDHTVEGRTHYVKGATIAEVGDHSSVSDHTAVSGDHTEVPGDHSAVIATTLPVPGDHW